MKPPAIYFFCCEEEDNLQDDIIVLAEGLKELGIPYYSRCNYWLQSTQPDDYLFKSTPDVSPYDCDILVFPYTWFCWVRMDSFDTVRRPAPEGLFGKGRRYQTVYMDTCDGHRTVSWEEEFRQFDVIFRTKLNRRAWHPGNFKPWALGLSRRIIQATECGANWLERENVLLSNFGASHPFPHGTREAAARSFDPEIAKVFAIDRTKDDLSTPPTDMHDRLMWRQTNRRYCRAYFGRLNASRAVSCFCGELIPPMPWRTPERYLVGGNRGRLQRLFFDLLAKADPRPPRAVQWDSWRFWETLSSGALAFNLDLEHYGVTLPVMPENWKHYIGVDLDRVDLTISRLRSERDRLPEIAEAGRSWALEHYSPKAMAARFLRTLGHDLSKHAPATEGD